MPGRGNPIVHCVVESLPLDSSSDPSLGLPSSSPVEPAYSGGSLLTPQAAWPPESYALSCCEGWKQGKALCLCCVCFSP